MDWPMFFKDLSQTVALGVGGVILTLLFLFAINRLLRKLFLDKRGEG